MCLWLIVGGLLDIGGIGSTLENVGLTAAAQNLVNSYYVSGALQVLIGIALVKELRADRSWRTVKLAICLIWIAWPLLTAIELFVFPPLFIGRLISFDGGGPQIAIGVVVLSAGFTAVWTAYLLQSERLKATYREVPGDTDF
jgi:hypothetical protein